MKPWFASPAEVLGQRPTPARADLEAERTAVKAIRAADGDLPEAEDLILFDLQTSVATRYVAMPVYHRHTQDCARA